MKKYLVPTLSAALLSFTVFQAAPAFADMKKNCHKEGTCIMEKIDKMKAKLRLTPDQMMKLKAMKARGRAFMHTSHNEMRKIYHESDKLAHEKNIDMKKLDALAARSGRIHGDRMKHRVIEIHGIEKILTPEQQQMVGLGKAIDTKVLKCGYRLKEMLEQEKKNMKQN